MKQVLFGVPETIAALQAKTLEYRGKLETAVNAGALIVENDAKERAPYLSGTLKRSIDHETVERSATRVAVSVGTDLEYARIHEFGGVIKAKNAPYLKFQTADGAWHSVKSVTMPPHPYLRPALDNNKGKVKLEIAAALKVIT